MSEPMPALCKDCRHSVERAGGSDRLYCNRPGVDTQQRVNGVSETSCYSERVWQPWFAPRKCGPNARYWEEK
jgi:hypothetical protein